MLVRRDADGRTSKGVRALSKVWMALMMLACRFADQPAALVNDVLDMMVISQYPVCVGTLVLLSGGSVDEDVEEDAVDVEVL